MLLDYSIHQANCLLTAWTCDLLYYVQISLVEKQIDKKYIYKTTNTDNIPTTSRATFITNSNY
jgi:hypothetical protein